MEVAMKDVSLPGPHTRMVMFADTVFKLKFKLSCPDMSKIDQALYSNETIQKDIKEATASILAHICNTGTPIPVKTRHIVVYPGCLPWKSVVLNKLQFSHGDKELKPHEQVIFLLVHIYKSPSVSQNADTSGNDTKCSLGKHLRSPLELECGQRSLGGELGGVARHLSARKRLKMDADSAVAVAEVPSMNESALPSPTEHAQIMQEEASNHKEFSFCSEAVASKPETGQNQPHPYELEFNSRDQPISLSQRIKRYVGVATA